MATPTIIQLVSTIIGVLGGASYVLQALIGALPDSWFAKSADVATLHRPVAHLRTAARGASSVSEQVTSDALEPHQMNALRHAVSWHGGLGASDSDSEFATAQGSRSAVDKADDTGRQVPTGTPVSGSVR